MTFDNKSIQLAQELLFHGGGLDFSVIPRSAEEILRYAHKITKIHPANRFFYDEMLLQLQSVKDACIYELRGLVDICYLVYFDPDENVFFILGPTLTSPLSETTARTQLRAQKISPADTDQLLSHALTLPVVPLGALHRIMITLLRSIKGIRETLPYHKLDYVKNYFHANRPSITEGYEEISNIQKIEDRYELISAMTEAVKQGNFSLTLKFFSKFQLNQEEIQRNPNRLRNLQNYCIILNSQLRYALQNQGLHPYRLDKISSEVGLRIEQLKSVNEANNFIYETLQQYCELVQNHAYPNLKPLIHLAVTYIKTHLSDNITVKDTAAELAVNTNYLSTQFHKEMGLSFIDFLNHERIQQAAALLRHTHMPIQHVAAQVGYNNASYFSKQFQHWKKMTPRQYRAMKTEQ
jgi:AraC-like DNA-binding protein